MNAVPVVVLYKRSPTPQGSVKAELLPGHSPAKGRGFRWKKEGFDARNDQVQIAGAGCGCAD